MPYVYILQSQEDGRYYVGSSAYLQSRLMHHEGGYTWSTGRMGEMKLVLSQEYPTIAEARRVERRIKNMKRHDFIDKMVSDGFIKLR